jgi:hypothetical protein
MFLRLLFPMLILSEQVIICTAIKDTVEFLDHVMHVTNMSCLTPRTLLQVRMFSMAAGVVISTLSCYLPVTAYLTTSADRLPFCRRQSLRQKREPRPARSGSVARP